MLKSFFDNFLGRTPRVKVLVKPTKENNYYEVFLMKGLDYKTLIDYEKLEDKRDALTVCEKLTPSFSMVSIRNVTDYIIDDTEQFLIPAIRKAADGVTILLFDTVNNGLAECCNNTIAPPDKDSVVHIHNSDILMFHNRKS